MNREMVLPSGKFAEIDRITWRDWIIVRNAQTAIPGSDLTALMICHHIKIDGEKISYANVMELDIQDGLAMERELAKMIGGPVVSGDKS